MGRIANQFRREFRKALQSKIVPLDAIMEGERNAKSLPDARQLMQDGHDPAHAIYADTTNLISAFAEVATALPPLHCAFDFLKKAEDTYAPGYPPMSPLTTTYYVSWTLFDVPFGRDKETIGDCFADLADLLGLDPIQVEAVRKLRQSRMGIYEILNGIGAHFRLRELITDREVEALIPTGFRSTAGSLLYVRLLPPLEAVGSRYVAVTTPYVLAGSVAADWIAYFERHQVVPGTVGAEHRLHQHMKVGRANLYWSEFVFYGFVNFRADAIFPAGFPDRPRTQPHHPEFDPSTFRLQLVKEALAV